MHQYINAALREVSKNGVLWVVKKGAHVLYRDYTELKFDLRWRVNTRSTLVDRKKNLIAPDFENFPYEGISPGAFRETMQSMAHLPMPKLFVDMGCGKGRALLLASKYGFGHIVGVELDPDLKQMAERNIKSSRIQQNKKATIEVVCENAKDYAFPDEDAVIFFYNPFNESVMAATLQNIKRSAQLKKERYIIYHHPVYKSLLSNPEEYTLLVKKDGYSVYRVNI